MEENKYDIGIVCMMNYNIGNNMTNYALYQYLVDQGYRVIMIDSPASVPESAFYLDRGPLIYFKVNPYEDGSVMQRMDNKWELYEDVEKCDIYIVGSDQLWRDIFVRNLDFYSCLDWVPSYKYKISYSTSMGTGGYSDDGATKAKFGALISRFNSVSVRESSSQKYLMDKLGIEATITLDPVFLCDINHYDQMCRYSKNIDNYTKYTAAYLLDINSLKEEVVKNTADLITDGKYTAMTEPIVTDFLNYDLNYFENIMVEDWLAIMKNAEFIVTDSFHGLCFSLIFKKQFIVLFNSDNWRGIERFRSLLSQLGLESRLVTDIEAIDYSKLFFELIDYKSVDKILDKLRENSEKWLTSSISNGKTSFISQMTTYDFLYNHLNNIRKKDLILEKEFLEIKKQNMNLRTTLFIQSHIRLDRISLDNRKRSNANMNVIGWGAGYYFDKNIDEVRKHYEVKYICDNNPNLWSKELRPGVICISPETLMKMNDVFVVIFIEHASVAVKISNQLLDMGISNFEHVDNWLNYILEG